MSNEIYTDLELEYERTKQKHEALRMTVIEMLTNQYSDDAELGKRVREFINIQNADIL